MLRVPFQVVDITFVMKTQSSVKGLRSFEFEIPKNEFPVLGEGSRTTPREVLNIS